MIIRDLANGFIAENDVVALKFTNIVAGSDYLSCTLRAYSKIPYPEVKYLTKVNLFNPRTIKDVADALSEIFPGEWTPVLRQVFTEVAESILMPFKPEKIEFIENPNPYWLIKNFIVAEAPNIIFAPGGKGKSLLALFVGFCVENAIDFFGQTKQAKVLYLDWETDIEEMKRRATLIKNGLDCEQVKPPDYLRMYARLTDTIDAILEICTEHGYQLVIIDSAACAIGGDINSAQEVIQFFSQIRRMNAAGITTLIISHVSKHDKENHERTPIGSVYFENFPRIAWELRSEYDENQKKYRLGLFCRKSNIGHLSPLGLEMILSPEAFFFIRADVEAMRGKDTLATAILQVLEEKAMTTKQLAEELGAKTVTVRVTLSRLREQKKVERYGELWRLVREATPF